MYTGNPSQPLILIFIPEIAIKTSLNTSRNDNKISQIQIMAILMPEMVKQSNKKGSKWKSLLLRITKMALGTSSGTWILVLGPKMTK